MGEMKKNAGALLRKGSRGDEVRELQQKLAKLGYEVKSDGIFGDDTEKAVIQLQTMFGYNVDALVGEGTQGLIDAQIGYGWNAKSPDAAEKAMQSQGKGSTASSGAKPMQSQDKSMQSQGKPMQSQDKSMQSQDKSMQSQGKPMQSPPAKAPGTPPKGAQSAKPPQK